MTAGRRAPSTKSLALAANRRNALASTGPRTTEGKMVSSQNALKHGLTAKAIVVERLGESWEEFDDFRSAILDNLEPAGVMEEFLCERIALMAWRLQRAAYAEGAVIHSEAEDVFFEPPPGSLRAGNSLSELLGGFKPPKELEATMKSVGSGKQEAILRYETTIERQLYRALDALERLQRARLGGRGPQVNVRLRIERVEIKPG